MTEPENAMTESINSHELDVLEMMAGTKPGRWGAWVGACLEYLSAQGLCTHGPKFTITDAGRAVLAEHRPLAADRQETPK